MKLLTLNLRHTADRWTERFPLIVKLLHEEAADIITLQEVSDDIQQADMITEALNSLIGNHPYITFFEKRIKLSRQEGIAIFSRLPVIETERLDLIQGGRVAQRIMVMMEGKYIDIINTHLHHFPPLSEINRFPQARRILDWIKKRSGLVHGSIILGDLNTLTISSTYRQIRKDMDSAYVVVHGHEPKGTFPSPLSKIQIPLITLDYVFITPGAFRVAEARVIGYIPADHDSKLYPSDHFGLAVELQIANKRND